MNNPEYILVDVFGTKDNKDQLTGGVLHQVKVALNLSVLNYQYGYITELNETLAQWNKNPDFAPLKFPLVWLAQPFTINRTNDGYYGSVEDLRIFIIYGTTKDLKAYQRMDQNFKTVIYPIYRELVNQLENHPAIVRELAGRKHKFTDRYYWGEQQQSVLNDVVDCSEIRNLQLKIHNNQNCS